MPSSQTPRPMPKPTGVSRDEVKARVYAKIQAERALPASEQIANMLHAVRTHAEAQQLLAGFRKEIAADFEAALLKTTDGDDVYDDFAIPAAEVRRILAELVEGGAR